MNWPYTLTAAAALGAAALWPRRGFLALWREGRELAGRMRREDALKHILKCEANGQVPTLEGIAGLLQVDANHAARLLADLERQGLVSFDGGALSLQPAGRELAVHVVRAHRLWELYLAEQTGVAEADWHRRAEHQEHLLTPEQTAALAARLGHPARDPHGDEIPDRDGALSPDTGQSLNSLSAGQCAIIVHIEDEPIEIYAQLAAQGLRAGVKVCVLEKSPHRLRIRADGGEHMLAPVLAQNISVAAAPETGPRQWFAEATLAALLPGQQARVVDLSPACRGPERRRLLDLGFVPGTIVGVEMTSPIGDPTAYRVRGALIALRRQQSNLIRIAGTEAAPA